MIFLSEHWPDPILISRENSGQSIGLLASVLVSDRDVRQCHGTDGFQPVYIETHVINGSVER